MKINSVVDETVIDALYRASQAGVQVDLVVRGICAVRVGVPGLSENIRVRSILGRFLEHSRIFAFANSAGPALAEGPESGPEVFIGSADLMHRNLDRRVETLIRISDPQHVGELIGLLDESMADTTASWHLMPDGRGEQRPPRPAGGPHPAAAPSARARPVTGRRSVVGTGPTTTASPTAGMQTPVIMTAGGLVWRRRGGALQVQLVHRPRYDDWSWPKGKLEIGESFQGAAIREVGEETGKEIVLGRPLPGLQYLTPDGTVKRVHYWAARRARKGHDSASLTARAPVAP
jgi:hypothetical protein